MLSYTTFLTSLKIQQSKQVAQVPISTRGVGLISQATHDVARGQIPDINNVCTVNQLYRTNLGHLSVQLHESDELGGIIDIENKPFEDNFIADEIRSVAKSNVKTFAASALLTDSLGQFTHLNTHYKPFIPVNEYIDLDVPTTPEHSQKRQAVSERILKPNPYTVTIKNLRKTVEALTQAATPVQYREYFRALNPLPGAIWSDDSIIMNPDQIIPSNYSRLDFRDDCLAVQKLVGKLGSKMSSLLGEVSLDGKGSASQLCSMNTTLFIDGTRLRERQSITRFRSSRPLEDQDMLCGMLHLLGEYPAPCPPVYSIRDPSVADNYMDTDWPTVIDVCLKRR